VGSAAVIRLSDAADPLSEQEANKNLAREVGLRKKTDSAGGAGARVGLRGKRVRINTPWVGGKREREHLTGQGFR